VTGRKKNHRRSSFSSLVGDRALKSGWLLLTLSLLTAWGCGESPQPESSQTAALQPQNHSQGQSREIWAAARGLEFLPSDWDRIQQLDPDNEVGFWPSKEHAESTVRNIIGTEFARMVLEKEALNRGLGETERGRDLAEGARRAAGTQWAEVIGIGQQFSLTEEELRSEYEERDEWYNQPREIWLQHIFFVLGDIPQEASDAKRVKAEEVAALVREDPARFAEFAAEHSEAISHSPDETIVFRDPAKVLPEVREPLWNAERGDVIGPIESSVGLHIFKVLNYRDRTFPYNEVRGFLAERLLTEHVDQQAEDLMAEAEERFGLILAPIVDEVTPETVIVSGSETVTGADLHQWGMLDLSIPSRPTLHRARMRTAQRQSTILALAREQGWVDNLGYQRAQEVAERSALVEALWHRRSDELLGELTDQTLRELYEANIEEHTHPLAMQVRDLRLSPRSLVASGETRAMMELQNRALALRARWEQGESLADLIREVSPDKDPDALIWLFPRDRDQYWFGPVADLATGEVSQPMPRQDQSISLFEVVRIETDVPQPFEEVVGEMKREITTQRLDAAKDQWMQEFAEEIEWSIPEEFIAQFVMAPAPLSVSGN